MVCQFRFLICSLLLCSIFDKLAKSVSPGWLSTIWSLFPHLHYSHWITVFLVFFIMIIFHFLCSGMKILMNANPLCMLTKTTSQGAIKNQKYDSVELKKIEFYEKMPTSLSEGKVAGQKFKLVSKSGLNAWWKTLLVYHEELVKREISWWMYFFHL